MKINMRYIVSIMAFSVIIFASVSGITTAVSTNSPPTAKIISVTPNPAFEGETITFAGSGNDTDGTIVEYRWTIDNLSHSLPGGIISMEPTFNYSSFPVGDYRIGLYVKDNDGAWSEYVGVAFKVIVNVTEPEPTGPTNSPPTAKIVSVTPNPAFEGETITFVGSGNDTDGTIVEYRWIIDTNISIPIPGRLLSTEPTFNYSSFPGEKFPGCIYRITLYVKDNNGTWSEHSTQASVQFNVIANVTEPPPEPTNSPPTAKIISVTPNPVFEGETITFVGSGNDTDGTIVEYKWYIDNTITTPDDVYNRSIFNRSAISEQQTFTYGPLLVGEYRIYLFVKDDNRTWSNSDFVVFKVVAHDAVPSALPSVIIGAVVGTTVVAASFAAIAINEPIRYSFFKAFMPLLLLYNRLKKGNVDGSFARGRIYQCIFKNPCVSYGDIKKNVELQNGELVYHLDVMEREKHVVSYHDRRHKYYHIHPSRLNTSSSVVQDTLKNTLSEIERKIIDAIKNKPGISPKEIATTIGVSKRMISYHLSILKLFGLVVVNKKFRKSECFLGKSDTDKDNSIDSKDTAST